MSATFEQSQQVTVVATRLQLRGWRHLRRFFRTNAQVVQQLKTAPGYLRHHLRADFLRLRFYTISMWTDDAAIDAFVRAGSHREAIAVFDAIAVRERSAFVRWKASGLTEVTWQEAVRRLAQLENPGF